MTITRVLITDDNDFQRLMLRQLFAADPQIDVIGEASNGAEAVALTGQLKPDLVTMDICMPGMDGFEAIERIMQSHATPILVITSRGDAETAFAAISKGALEVFPKPDIDAFDSDELTRKIKSLARVQVVRHIRGVKSKPTTCLPAPVCAYKHPVRIIAIAASTGGPKTLAAILGALPATLPVPIVIAQHITSGFDIGLAEWLNTICALTVCMGTPGDRMMPGHAYLAPADRHMRIDNDGCLELTPIGSADIYKPSCDALLSSAADCFGRNCIGVILTGMGNDGVAGLAKIKAAGGCTLAQSRSSCIIYGMPKIAIESDVVDRVLDPAQISDALQHACGGMAATIPQ